MLISLMSVLGRFYKVMRTGWDDREFRGLPIVLGTWVALGTIIYSVREEVEHHRLALLLGDDETEPT